MKAKGTLKVKSKLQYFVLIENEYNKKKTKLKNIPVYFDLEENLDGKVVEVEYSKEGEKITVNAIIHEGKTYKKTQSVETKHKISHKSYRNSYGKGSFSHRKFSKTPYNFVPLNDKLILRDIFSRKTKCDGFLKPECANNTYQKEKYTGRIELSIENETPLFIGAYKIESNEEKGFKEIVPYKINDKPAIPGSSIRGMLYSLIEIVGWGPMVNMLDKPVYFRSVRDDFSNGNQLKFGVLSYEKGNYKIYDFTNSVEKLDYRTYYKELQIIDDKYYIGLSSGKIMGKVHSFGISKKDLYFENCKVYESKSINAVLEDYQSDTNRADEVNKEINIIKEASEHNIKDTNKYGCPVWFSAEGEEVKSIGHAKYHRIPASLRSIDMLPSKHKGSYDLRQDANPIKEPYALSLAEIIFGTSEFRASKVRIEDALPKKAEFGEKRLLKSLQSPKIKSANLYLEAENDKPDWNEESKGQKIRGFKMYYNKSDRYEWYDLIEGTDKKKKGQQQKLQSIISPIKPKSKFKTNLHFNNLSGVELGALLFAIQLPDDLRHSLGMGKPFGLGQVKIKIEKLRYIDVEKRYRGNQSEALSSFAVKDDFSNLITEFEKFVLEEIGKNDKKSLWEVERLENLIGLMQIRNDSSEDIKSEYMDLKSFKEKCSIINEPKNLESYRIENIDFLKQQ